MKHGQIKLSEGTYMEQDFLVQDIMDQPTGMVLLQQQQPGMHKH